MKKPTIKVTKWLSDIPVEATCSACVNIAFKAHASNAIGSGHRPNREEYQRSLQAQFDEHLKLVHTQA
jgi:hypothetical protein